MKKTLIILLYTIIIFDSCTRDSHSNNVTSDDFEVEIQWISLVYSDNEKAKDDVRNALKEDFDFIIREYEFENKTIDIKSIPIAIAFHDFNHDGRDEIIAFVSNMC